MAERSITYCSQDLQVAWYAAEKEFSVQYPELPQPFLTCTYRSPEEQTCLYRQPFDGIDNDKDGKIDEADEKVTNAPAMKSLHNFKPAKAFDIAFKKEGKVYWDANLFQKFSKIIRSIDPRISWGGSWLKFKDYPHFELDVKSKI